MPHRLLHLLLQVSLVTLDLSFISVLKVMPALAGVMAPGAQMVVLIKPQFEAGRAQVGAGGLVKDPQVIKTCCSSSTLAS
jgi:23S rRNA (cytidine1920-2'-O)/16S rRNA (cytidine1409-2'-O)-methyltransferase